MSHKKALSQGSIPFSWEDKPGVCKTPNNNECSLQKISPSSLPPPFPSHVDYSKKKIPLPPYPLSQPPPLPRRSTSRKGFKRQDDPFLVAYKECTKGEKNGKLLDKNKRGVGFNFSPRRIKFTLSCRSISDARDDYVMQPVRIPMVRTRALLTLEDDHKQSFNHGTWL
ncbi:uncharacterized protein LOC130944656 [Arachis stenosperma]|uniref:uncharacterized protein LOC130944656 n=1 Tax=Arachis stenosperma TaxID=217475 RepID=UPI0025AC9143|nr:uncharacterized protein LOC130944656 [Arachis stenosperma]